MSSFTVDEEVSEALNIHTFFEFLNLIIDSMTILFENNDDITQKYEDEYKEIEKLKNEKVKMYRHKLNNENLEEIDDNLKTSKWFMEFFDKMSRTNQNDLSLNDYYSDGEPCGCCDGRRDETFKVYYKDIPIVMIIIVTSEERMCTREYAILNQEVYDSL
ncbi:hypothetical protein QKT26_gp94 [Carcinus maenas nudivirus]|uniref:Uncharacterized protein n=1 Tax=Carcinus maenas nudivirus TaxID=2880837 RepID=A0AAE8Y0J6_9VIRU|nr:hypothetical protein QKT26_gp94 [Carcinus maenas nudivirus]UBZ25684.1 hypothetical protein CmNV_093 [Carcinus maenas nudivirus]